MLPRLLVRSVRARRRRFALLVLSILLGSAVMTLMVAITTATPGLVGGTLQRYGPNLAVVPTGGSTDLEIAGIPLESRAADPYVAEDSLDHLGSIHLASALRGVSPFLDGMADLRPAGAREGTIVPVTGAWFSGAPPLQGLPHVGVGVTAVYPWWKVRGSWPGSGQGDVGVLLGAQLAARTRLGIGDSVELTAGNGSVRLVLTAKGILTTDGPEEDRLFLDLGSAQVLLDLPGRLTRTFLSATVVPDDALARKDPDRMTENEYERWYCTPYLGAVARQVGETLPGTEVRPLRQVATGSGIVELRAAGLFLGLGVLSFVASLLAVATTAAGGLLERQSEIGLLAAVGAQRGEIRELLLGEVLVAGIVGGLLGLLVGAGLAAVGGLVVFGAPALPTTLHLLVVFAAAVGMGLAGGELAIRRAVARDPAVALRGM